MRVQWAAHICAGALVLPLYCCNGASAYNEVSRGLSQRSGKRGTLRGVTSDLDPLHTDARLYSQPQADIEAETEFVRQCTISMSVRNAEYLPTSALDAFCGESDAVVECRLALSGALKKTHKKGGSISNFCTDAYGWVASTFGMICPLHCEKLQCRSTCDWLEDHKKLQTTNLALDDAYTKARGFNSRIDKLRETIEQKRQECLDNNRTIAQAKTDMERAQTALTEVEQEVVATAETNLGKVNTKIASLEADFASTGKHILEAEGNLTTYTFDTDKMKVKHKALLADGEAFTHFIKKREKSLQFVHGQQQKAAGVVKKNQEALSQLKPARDQIATAAEAQAKKYVAAEHAFARAGKAIKEAEENNAPIDSMRDLAALVARQKKNADEEKVKFRDIASKHKKLTTAININEKEVGLVVTELRKLVARSSKLKLEIQASERAQKEVLKHAEDLFGKHLADEPEQMKKLQGVISDARKMEASIKKTIDFQEEQQGLRSTELEKGQEQEKKARKEFTLRQTAVEDADGVSSKCEGNLADLVAEEDKDNKKFFEKNKELLADMEKLRGDKDALDKDKPEIVRQHGLALVTFMWLH